MRTSSAILFSFILAAAPGLVKAASALPPAIADLKTGEASVYLTKVAEIPKSVAEVLSKAMQTEKLEMADPGKDWNGTDYVVDKSLPFRRLIWATEVKGHFIVQYERGGYASSTHFLVVSAEDKNGKRSLEWSVTAFKKAPDLAAFMEMVESGKTRSDPRTKP